MGTHDGKPGGDNTTSGNNTTGVNFGNFQLVSISGMKYEM